MGTNQSKSNQKIRFQKLQSILYNEPFDPSEPDPHFKLHSVFSNQTGQTFLHIAVLHQRKNIVDKFLRKFPKETLVDKVDKVKNIQHGETALHIAAHVMNDEIYNTLSDFGFNRYLKNKVRFRQADETPDFLLNANRQKKKKVKLVGEEFKTESAQDRTSDNEKYMDFQSVGNMGQPLIIDPNQEGFLTSSQSEFTEKSSDY